jgi:hypothetical protein
MWVDIRSAAQRYSEEISDQQLQSRFVACMKQLYPK